MITVKTGAYNDTELEALYYAFEEAIITLQNHTSCADCATCKLRNACTDLNKTINFLANKLSNHSR